MTSLRERDPQGKGDPKTCEDVSVRISPRGCWQRCDALGVQVLIVHGDKDALVPLRNSVRLSKLLPNAELKVMKNAGHVPHEERPEEFLDLVHNFLQPA